MKAPAFIARPKPPDRFFVSKSAGPVVVVAILKRLSPEDVIFRKEDTARLVVVAFVVVEFAVINDVEDAKPTLVKLKPPPLILEVQGVCEPPVLKQVPLMAKHPFVKLSPLAKVEVELPVILRALVDIPPVKVEVAVPVTVRLATVVVPNCERPVTARDVDVAFVAVRELRIALVAWKIEAKKDVVVAFVPVAFTKVRF